MSPRWPLLVFLLASFAGRACAAGFALSLANATVQNVDADHNGIASVGDRFTIANAPFAAFRSIGDAPALTDNDLGRYTVSLNGAVADVKDNAVHYTGTFTVRYTGPAAVANIETGALDLRAAYATDGSAVVRGVFLAKAGNESDIPPFNATDFAPLNPGRFYGVYRPTPGDATTGTIDASLSAGLIGFTADLGQGTLVNVDVNDNGMADVGDTFTLTAPIAAYNSVGAPPIDDNDLNRYSVAVTGKVVGVTKQAASALVLYSGTFAVRYTGPEYPNGIDIETGACRLQAFYGAGGAGAAYLTGDFAAQCGATQAQPPFDQTDFAIFNPARFEGTYTPSADGSTGAVNGKLVGGCVGLSATISSTDASIATNDPNGNGRADVGETFTCTASLASFISLGGPVLTRYAAQPKDTLSNYTVTLNGTVTAVDGNIVRYGNDPAHGYASTFTISYADNSTDPITNVPVEHGAFDITATFGPANAATLTGTLTAAPGFDNNLPLTGDIDFAPFNPIAFTGRYTGASQGWQSETLRGTLMSGTLVPALHTRRTGYRIYTPLSAATLSNGQKVIVACGSTAVQINPLVERYRLYVLDPATGDDAPGWEPGADGLSGKYLDGITYARPTIYGDAVFVATSTGRIYRFNLRTGALMASTMMDPGVGCSSVIAYVPYSMFREYQDSLVLVYGSVRPALVKLNAVNLMSSNWVSFVPSRGALTVTPDNRICVSTDDAVYTLEYTSFNVLNVIRAPSLTAPLRVGPKVYIASGIKSNNTIFRRINGATGVTEAAFDLGDPLTASPFFERGTNLVQAATIYGAVHAFHPDGSYAGRTLPALCNRGMGASFAMPVVTHGVFYSSADARLVSANVLTGGNIQTVDILSSVNSAFAATGQTPGHDYVATATWDGLVHFQPVR